jgi:hypothetical protein
MRNDKVKYPTRRCKVYIDAKEEDGRWRVAKSFLEHNHASKDWRAKLKKSRVEVEPNGEAQETSSPRPLADSSVANRVATSPSASVSPFLTSSSMANLPFLLPKPVTSPVFQTSRLPSSSYAFPPTSGLPPSSFVTTSPLEHTPPSPFDFPALFPSPFSASPTFEEVDDTGDKQVQHKTTATIAKAPSRSPSPQERPLFFPSFFPHPSLASSASSPVKPRIPRPAFPVLPPLPPTAPSTTHLLPFLTSLLPLARQTDLTKLALFFLKLDVSTVDEVRALGTRDRASLIQWVGECREKGMEAGTALWLVEVLEWAKGEAEKGET